ncbi:hypothetical protein [Mastigocladopsis repens]|uniref:hypothetical protein n=1 Tax=Mastigocladopsis repens TaxID=221287 RepID=UPI0002FB874A|nr:hypothetical protein [Mastigocladopsis repens]
MLEIIKLFNQLRRQIAVVLLAGFVWFMSLPATSSQAAGYYSGDYSSAEKTVPYYASNANTAKAEEKMGRYANTTPDIGGDDYIESGKRAAEVIPKELGTGIRQKNPGNMLQRVGEELGNDQPQRAFGAKDYDRSPIEQELARNKADRGDYNQAIDNVKRQTGQ